MIFRLTPQSGVPMYLQLIEQVRYAVESGALRPGDQLPGIRKLSEDLVMNPNTVAKAYREMEHAGLIVLRHGSGAFIAEQPHNGRAPDVIRKGQAVMRRALAALAGMGLNEGEIRRLLEAELQNSVKEDGDE
jgi:GntR family transcriptional regulator